MFSPSRACGPGRHQSRAEVPHAGRRRYDCLPRGFGLEGADERGEKAGLRSNPLDLATIVGVGILGWHGRGLSSGSRRRGHRRRIPRSQLPPHRRNLYRVIIGAQGVALAARLDALDEQIKDKNAEIKDNRALMQRHLAPGMTAEVFIGLAEDADVDAKIAAKEQELQAARQAAQLQQKAGLTALAVPVFPAAFAALLAKTFANVAADAERRVGEHIARHRMQARGETWLTEGLGYVTDGTCPFCAQALDGVGLIQDYTSFFSREYHALRDEVTALKGQVDAAVGDRAAAGIEQAVLQNSNSAESWRQYCDVAAPVLPEAGRIGEIMGALRGAAQALLDTKAGTPLDAVPPDDRFTQALGDFEALRTSFGTYNGAVATANAVITARKQQAQAANVRDVETALARLKAQKARHTEEVRPLCATDARLQDEKTALEGEKRTARERLDAHSPITDLL